MQPIRSKLRCLGKEALTFSNAQIEREEGLRRISRSGPRIAFNPLRKEYSTMRKTIGFFALTAMTTTLFAASKDEVNKRLEEAASVFSEITAATDKGIPQDLLEKAHCAVIVPGMKKGAFIVGAQYGKGFLTCRRKGGDGWSAPAAIKI